MFILHIEYLHVFIKKLMNDVKTFLLFTYRFNNEFVFIIRTMIKIGILSEIRWLKTLSLRN